MTINEQGERVLADRVDLQNRKSKFLDIIHVMASVQCYWRDQARPVDVSERERKATQERLLISCESARTSLVSTSFKSRSTFNVFNVHLSLCQY